MLLISNREKKARLTFILILQLQFNDSNYLDEMIIAFGAVTRVPIPAYAGFVFEPHIKLFPHFVPIPRVELNYLSPRTIGRATSITSHLVSTLLKKWDSSLAETETSSLASEDLLLLVPLR